MSLVTIAGVSKSHAAQHLFSDVGLMISAGRRIAVVGPNGAGKTTLLELITGDQEPDAGTITRAREVVIGYLRQEVAQTRGRSVLAEVLAGAGEVSGIERRMRHIEAEMEDPDDDEELAELMDEYGRLQHRFEALGGYGMEAEARRILAGLGFADGDVERDIGQFSGGWMMRVALARLLLQNPDVLLLDEPTNHLDLASVEWLQGFLADYAGAIVLVSHDRDFINEIANRVVELHDGERDRVRRRLRRLRRAAHRAHGPARGGGEEPAAQDRAHAGLHRPLPLQGIQGTPGPVPRQGARAARPRRVARRAREVGEVPLPGPGAQRPDGDHAQRHREAVRRQRRLPAAT